MSKDILVLLSAVVIVFALFITGSCFFGVYTLWGNLVSEIIGIIITIFIINWLLSRSQTKRELPLKKSLFFKIENDFDNILRVLAGELPPEYTWASPQEQLELIKTASRDILEILQLGKTLFSLELQSEMLILTGLLEGSVSLSASNAPSSTIISHDLRVVARIRRICKIFNNEELIKMADGTKTRLEDELEWAE